MGVKTELLIQHYLRLAGPNGVLIDPPNLKAPKKSTVFIPVWRNLKSRKVEITMRNLIRTHFRQGLGRLIKLKIDKRARVSWLHISLEIQSFV